MAKTFDDKKIIYTMNDVSRAYGTKVVLKNISISYYYGAKIGVIGANGSGKSSLFKILAGKDTEFTGETSLLPGYTIGYLEQEPELEAGKTVTFSESAEFIIRRGSANIVDPSKQNGIPNLTTGKDDANNAKAGLQQLYLVPRDDGRGIVAKTDLIIMVRGGYKIK